MLFYFPLHFHYIKAIVLTLKLNIGAGEMVKWLKALVALAEDAGLASSACMVAHSHPYLQFQELQHPLLAPHETTCTCRQNILPHTVSL